jgi:hypothetical protein
MTTCHGHQSSSLKDYLTVARILQIKVSIIGRMNFSPTTVSKQTYYRLIALWVLCEAMLGGIIHALKIPVSGLIVGSAAVICICLIAHYAPGRGNIFRATIIVCIFKMILSPQAPILAYFAVFFQGVVGELLFRNKKFYKASCLLLGLIALLESGLQRIIVLTVVYGNNFWKVLNDFINNLSGQKSFTNYSLYIGIGYVVLHLLTGVVVGWWAGIIPERVSNWRDKYPLPSTASEKVEQVIPVRQRRGTWVRKMVLIIWIILILLYLQSNFKIGDPILPARLPLQILIRSVIIILAWYFLVGPILSFLLKKWLQTRKSASKQEVAEISMLLPSIKAAMNESWKASASMKGIKKIILWGKLVLVYVLYASDE